MKCARFLQTTIKIKVKLSVQNLSACCARALHYLRISGVKKQVYLQRMDNLFDILNSRSIRGKGYKSLITEDNVVTRFAFLKQMKDLY